MIGQKLLKKLNQLRVLSTGLDAQEAVFESGSKTAYHTHLTVTVQVKENLLCNNELSGKFLHLPAFGCFIGSIGDVIESGADGPDTEVDKNRSI